jgi:hypothetical protein
MISHQLRRRVARTSFEVGLLSQAHPDLSPVFGFTPEGDFGRSSDYGGGEFQVIIQSSSIYTRSSKTSHGAYLSSPVVYDKLDSIQSSMTP